MKRFADLNRASRNVVWNLLGGVSTGVLVVLATPWYVSRLGLEGYGVLGLWLTIQVMMGLLDLGMGATVIKEFARSSDGAGRGDLLRALEYVYWTIAAVATGALIAGASWVSVHWLDPRALSPDQVARAFRVMGVALGFQFPFALYAAGLAGLQEQGRMNALQVFGSLLRYVCGAAVLLWRPDLVSFFAVQAFVAAVQTWITRRAVWNRVSESPALPARARLEHLRRVWRFSAGMAVTAASGVLLANMDRLVLSRMLPTAELGKYALAFTASGLLQMGIQPFYRALFPRYAELCASGDAIRLQREYFWSCRLMAAVLVPAASIGWVFAPQLVTAWLGKPDHTVITIFRWLLVGVGGAGLTWLPAAFQQAHGWTRLHAAMMVGAVLVGTPVMVLAIRSFGTIGATTVWIVHGVSDLTLGLTLMHRRLLPGQLAAWYRSVLLAPVVTAVPLVALSWWAMPRDVGRWSGLLWASATGAVLLAATLSRAASYDRGGELQPAASVGRQ